MASYIETSKFCKTCNKQVLARRKGVNHILHLILSLCTVGFWVIIWILVVISNIIRVGEWRCSVCAEKYVGQSVKHPWGLPMFLNRQNL